MKLIVLKARFSRWKNIIWRVIDEGNLKKMSLQHACEKFVHQICLHRSNMYLALSLTGYKPLNDAYLSIIP